MGIGEDQIIGQVRAALKRATEQGTTGRVLGELGRVAPTGKWARAETMIGRAGRSLANAAVELAAARLGASPGPPRSRGARPSSSGPAR